MQYGVAGLDANARSDYIHNLVMLAGEPASNDMVVLPSIIAASQPAPPPPAARLGAWAGDPVSAQLWQHQQMLGALGTVGQDPSLAGLSTAELASIASGQLSRSGASVAPFGNKMGGPQPGGYQSFGLAGGRGPGGQRNRGPGGGGPQRGGFPGLAHRGTPAVPPPPARNAGPSYTVDLWGGYRNAKAPAPQSVLAHYNAAALLGRTGLSGAEDTPGHLGRTASQENFAYNDVMVNLNRSMGMGTGGRGLGPHPHVPGPGPAFGGYPHGVWLTLTGLVAFINQAAFTCNCTAPQARLQMLH